MPQVFLGRNPADQPIMVDFDSSTSRLIDVGWRKAVIPKGVKVGGGWSVGWHPSAQTFYAVRKVNLNGRRTTEYLHRLVCGLIPGDGLDVHHRDGCGLNCARGNMQVMLKSEHARLTAKQVHPAIRLKTLHLAHKASHAKSQTGFYGVSPVKNRFVAMATISGLKCKYLGRFSTAVEAAKAVNDFLILHDPTDWRINQGV
jgi:hypothetical protein